MKIFELPEAKIKPESVNRDETASDSKSLFRHCLEVVPHIFLEATKKKWRELFKQRNQQN